MASGTSGRKQTVRRQPRRWLWPAIIGGIVVITAVFALVVTHQPAATPGAAAGATVPSVSLPSTAGHPISLNDYHGRKVVLYFYEGST